MLLIRVFKCTVRFEQIFIFISRLNYNWKENRKNEYFLSISFFFKYEFVCLDVVKNIRLKLLFIFILGLHNDGNENRKRNKMIVIIFILKKLSKYK